MIYFDWDDYFREYFLNTLMMTKIHTAPKSPVIKKKDFDNLPNHMELYIDGNELMTLQVKVDHVNREVYFWLKCLEVYVYHSRVAVKFNILEG